MASSKFSQPARLLAIFQRWADHRLVVRQQAHARLELKHMSDHELKDLGIGRSEIQARAEPAFQA